MIEIFPSLIASDILNLASTIRACDHLCAGYHLDMMDNHFVPNITWGPMFINAIDKATPHPCWIHLMIENPKTMISRIYPKAKSIISIHLEHINKDPSVINFIIEKNCEPSIAISPKLPVDEILPLLGKDIRHVLVMSVEPGFSGQEFIPDAIDKVKALVAYRKKTRTSFTIAIDGGINKHTIGELAELGVNQFAIGSGIFAQKDPTNALLEFRNIKK